MSVSTFNIVPRNVNTIEYSSYHTLTGSKKFGDSKFGAIKFGTTSVSSLGQKMPTISTKEI